MVRADAINRVPQSCVSTTLPNEDTITNEIAYLLSIFLTSNCVGTSSEERKPSNREWNLQTRGIMREIKRK